MFSKLMMVLKIPELRNKILLTLALLLVFRLGSFIPLPLLLVHVIETTYSARRPH